MNKRIYELAKEAAREMHETGTYSEPKFQEKFAELIVQECADIAKHHVMNISTYNDAEFVDEQIREHFGVRE